MRRLSLFLAAAAMPAAPVAVQPLPAPDASAPAAASSLPALAEAAARGETEPLLRALRTERDAEARALIQAWLHGMQLGGGLTVNPELRRLAAEGIAPAKRMAALTIIAAAAFTDGDYAEAARVGRTLEQLQKAAGQAQEAGETATARAMAELLAPEPRQRVEGEPKQGSTSARRDAAGLTRIDLKINGQAQDAVFDTGANLSVLSAATARRLGVRMLGGQASVGNSVQTQVPVQVGIIDRLEIAGTTLRNVPVLVIADAQLTFRVAGGYSIPSIVGFPVMRSLGRFTVHAGGTFTVEPTPRRPDPAAVRNLSAWANELFIEVEVGGIKVPLHLDSGANPSHLNSLFAMRHPKPLAGLPREQRRVAGAGGTATGEAVRWRDVPAEIAGRRFRAPAVLVEVARADGRKSPYLGVLGSDVLGLFSSYTIDLRAMRLELGEPRSAAASAK